MSCHTGKVAQRIAVSLDRRTVVDHDQWVSGGKLSGARLVRELAKIDPREEKQLAEQGLGDRAWPRC
jgi:RNA polymerase-interacting CarD/CdnL/TRCF family regulator